MTDWSEQPVDPGAVLSMRGLGKKFGDNWVLRDVDLTVQPGTIVGLIGPSGCGKTTTVRLATGAYRPDEGEVRLLGHEPADLPPRWRQRLGYLPQDPVLFDELSLSENLAFHSAVNGVKFFSRRHRRRLLKLVELDEHRRTAAGKASGGMRRRLALAASLVHEPALLLLDEPTAGIDPVLRRTFWEQFRAMRDNGQTFIITTQYVGEAADCDIVVLLSGGRVVASGPPEHLRRLAVGGDLIEVVTDGRPERTTLDELRRDPAIQRITATASDRLELLVDDGGQVLPRVTSRLEQDGLIVVDTEEKTVSYDEVFINLVERDRAQAARDEAGTRA